LDGLIYVSTEYKVNVEKLWGKVVGNVCGSNVHKKKMVFIKINTPSLLRSPYLYASLLGAGADGSENKL